MVVGGKGLVDIRTNRGNQELTLMKTRSFKEEAEL